MAFDNKPLDNPINWSFKIGRMFGIDLRMHILFIIGAVVLIAMEMPKPGSGASVSTGRVLVDALGTYAMLFFIVLVHEFGHCFGARYTGGDADEILIWPLGGLAYVQPPHEPRAHMITTLAGPAVNVVFCAISAVILISWSGTIGAVPWNPFYPATPTDPLFYPTVAQYWLIRFFGISYVLLIINMFPIFPFDGGRVMQAWFWPRRGYRASMELATFTGMVGAIVVGLLGLLSQEYLLMMIAVFGYLTCWQQRRMIREQGQFESEFGLDYSYSEFSEDSDSTQRQRKPGMIQRWRSRRAAARARRADEAEKARQALVESALKQISEYGIDSLTPKQRQALDDETRRRRMAESDQT
ncbi:MAG: metalloprotease [Planctomycetota bacterium]|jgi:Zn-dependent protease